MMMFLLLLMMMTMVMTMVMTMMMMMKKKMMMIMKWTNRHEKKKLLLGKDRSERERNTSAMFARRCLEVRKIWPDTCAFTRTRNRMNVMFARSVFVNRVI